MVSRHLTLRDTINNNDDINIKTHDITSHHITPKFMALHYITPYHTHINVKRYQIKPHHIHMITIHHIKPHHITPLHLYLPPVLLQSRLDYVFILILVFYLCFRFNPDIIPMLSLQILHQVLRTPGPFYL